MSKTLKDFPHVIKEIRLRWGTPPWLEKYLASIMLVEPKRKHRDGFPPAVFGELQKVLDVHQLFFGKGEDWNPEPVFSP